MRIDGDNIDCILAVTTKAVPRSVTLEELAPVASATAEEIRMPGCLIFLVVTLSVQGGQTKREKLLGLRW